MSISRDQWLANIISAVRNISDAAFQELTWRRLGPEISSPTEIFCTLYDDRLFTEFLEEHGRSLTAAQAAAWKNLDERMATYGGGSKQLPEAEAMLTDPEWVKVREAAKRFLAAFDDIR